MKQPISLTRGTTATFDINIVDTDGTPRLLETGEVLRFGVKQEYNDTTYIMNKELTSTDINAGGDGYTLTLAPEDTADLNCTKYCYDIGLQSGDNYYSVVDMSDLSILPNVTSYEGETP